MSQNSDHYIPQFYLRGWADPAISTTHKPRIWVADLKKRTIRNSKPRNVACANDYYSITQKDGSKIRAVDDILCFSESETAPVVAKLRRSEFDLADEERRKLAMFMGFLATRIPTFRTFVEEMMGKQFELLAKLHASDPKVFAASIREYEEATGSKMDVDVEKERQAILNDEYTIKADPAVSLLPIVENSENTARLIWNLPWAFLIAPDDASFFTTDNPVFWTDPTPRPPAMAGAGLGNPGVQLTFPISPRVCLLALRRARPGCLKIRTEFFDLVNQHVLRSARRFVFSNSQSGVKKVLSLLKTSASSSSSARQET